VVQEQTTFYTVIMADLGSSAAAAVLSADRYDAPKAREYHDLMDIIERRGKHGEEVYGNLMNVETRVLDTVDRVVNDSRLQSVEQSSFLNMSMFEIAGRTAQVMRDVYVDMYRVRSVRDFRRAFTKKSRPLYLGVVIVLVSVLLIVLQASSR